MGNFLSELFQFQHFQQFVNNRIDRLSKHDDRDIFDEEAILYDEGNNRYNINELYNTRIALHQGVHVMIMNV